MGAPSGGGGDPMVDAQIQQNEEELTYKRDQMMQTRLALIKSQNAPTWNAPNAAAQAAKQTPVGPAGG